MAGTPALPLTNFWAAHILCHQKMRGGGMPPWLGVCSPSQLLVGTRLLHSWTHLVCSSITWESQYQEKAGASPTCCRGTGDRILEGHLASCCPPGSQPACVRMDWHPRAQRGTATLHDPLRTLVMAHGPFMGTWHVPHGGRFSGPMTEPWAACMLSGSLDLPLLSGPGSGLSSRLSPGQEPAPHDGALVSPPFLLLRDRSLGHVAREVGLTSAQLLRQE